MTQPECAADMIAQLERDESKISISDGVITLNFQYEYPIELNRVRSYNDLLVWVLHLAEKSWMNSYRLSLFITKVAEHKGWKLNRHC